jgi:hypothetical protein
VASSSSSSSSSSSFELSIFMWVVCQQKMPTQLDTKGFWWWCITLTITAFSWQCPSSGILNTRGHNVSETGSVSILRWEGRHLLYFWVSHHSWCLPLTWGRKKSSFRKVVFPIFFRITNDGQNPKNAVILNRHKSISLKALCLNIPPCFSFLSVWLIW